MTFARRETAKSLISKLMGQMGLLPLPDIVVGSTDPNVAQLLYLANNAGQQLAMDDFKWQALSADFTITADGATEYALPSDFNGFESDSTWNRTTRLPAIGPLMGHEWSAIKARLLTGATFTTLYQISGDSVVFYEAPTVGDVIVLPYFSRGWLYRGSDPTDRHDSIQEDTDVVLFDPQLFIAKLKLLWYEEKGFDTSKVERAYNRIEAAAQANDYPGRTLSLAQSSGSALLGVGNVPDTNYGT